VNGEAIPEGHQLPEGFFGIMQRRVNLLNVQVKDLETGSIIDDEICTSSSLFPADVYVTFLFQDLRHYDTYENLVHDLVRPRRPPRQAYVILDIHLYIREEHVHRLTRRGTLWSPVQKSGYVVNTLPTGPGGWHEVELVYQAQPFLIALVVDGDEEKAAVLGEHMHLVPCQATFFNACREIIHKRNPWPPRYTRNGLIGNQEYV
jgi:hypothetical protein